MTRFVLIAITLILLSGCGFRPLYGNTTTLAGGTTALDQVMIEDIPGGVSGLNLKNALIDRFYNNGYPDSPPYALTLQLHESGRSIIIQKNDTTTRTQLVLNASYKLINRQTREVIDEGRIRSVSAFNNLPSQYTTMVTQADARDMAVRELADKITLRMAVVLEKR